MLVFHLRCLGEEASCRLATFLPQTPKKEKTFGVGFCLLALAAAVRLWVQAQEHPNQELPTNLCSAVDARPDHHGASMLTQLARTRSQDAKAVIQG